VVVDRSSARRLLAEPALLALDVDGAHRLELHAAILRRKPMLAEVFRECHRSFLALDVRWFGTTGGMRIELGAGVAPVRDSFPEVLATDIVGGAGIDRVLDALDIDLPDACARALYGQNCFHHFADPARFLREAERVVAPGGGVILVEPYHGPLASLLFKRLFASEDFDTSQRAWTTDLSGPMGGANQALSYVVFERDRERFAREFPGLELVHAEPLGNALRYLLSGGLNFRQLVPDTAASLLKGIERLLSPLRRQLALHQIIVLRRRSGRPAARGTTIAP
jgi:SAM-dependent methyltransferase